jgi:tripartite-type tricarboxylate transporter receptor subunit TctC
MGKSGYPEVVAPAGTPRNIVDLLNAEIRRTLHAPDLKERFIAAGMEAIGGTPEEFGTFLHAETVKWASVIKAANIKIE